eukprot:5542962-Pleurochrysis_carterae.AAC.1
MVSRMKCCARLHTHRLPALHSPPVASRAAVALLWLACVFQVKALVQAADGRHLRARPDAQGPPERGLRPRVEPARE